MGKQIIECVPNFSEGRDMAVINQITQEIEKVDGASLLDVDPGKATNRTVVTFVGEPDVVIEAAFQAIKKAAELIDMNKQTGEHPRMGATDVCPLIPISGISMEETAEYAHQLAKRVGDELGISIFMYESAATEEKRKNLASIRSGEYEAMEEKILKPEWKPDYGPTKLHKNAGVTAIGARDFLIAYNVNLNTTSTRRANSIAFDVREAGRVKREGGKVGGKILKDEQGNTLREAGKCKAVKAIGWFIEEYGVAQISMNLTDIKETPLHVAFEAVRQSANERGMRVTGSELVGLVPKKVLIEAGKYYLKQQNRTTGIPDREIMHIAVKSLGLDELSEFDLDKKVIEYQMAGADRPLVNYSLTEFAYKTAADTVAPGGGSVSAYVASVGAALGTMVANLSSHKRGWDDRVSEFSDWAEKGQKIVDELLYLVDEDTSAFGQIITAVRMPKGTDQEKADRKKALQEATIYATEVPYEVMKTSFKAFDLIDAMIEDGMPNSITDGGVGALCCLTGIEGAYMNVCVNALDIEDKEISHRLINDGRELVKAARERAYAARKAVFTRLGVDE